MCSSNGEMVLLLLVLMCASCISVERRQAEAQDPCASNPCLNGGTCQVRSGQQTEFDCTCTIDYEGVTCADLTLPDPCNSNPCRNGGTCIATQFNSNFTCVCPGNFVGHQCSVLSTQTEALPTTSEDTSPTIETTRLTGTNRPQVNRVVTEVTTSQNVSLTTSSASSLNKFKLFLLVIITSLVSINHVSFLCP